MPSFLAIPRPQPQEYASYAAGYVALVPGEDVLAALTNQLLETVALLSPLSEADGDLRYAPGKWSVKELVGHVCDAERVFAYRALHISRNDPTPLAGFEQDDYVRNGPFASCRLSELVEEFMHIRRATLSLFRSLDETAWLRRGVANQDEVSVRALAYIIAGHELHHRRILQEKYL